jgi:hypothetical protein
VQNLPAINEARKTEKAVQLRFFYAQGYERKYRTGKTNHTKCRIAGAVRHILKRSEGARCMPTKARLNAITGISERTIQRHLRSVLEWLQDQGELVLEVSNHKGYVVCTQAWLDHVAAHGDAFQDRRFSRSSWLTKAQRPFTREGGRQNPYKECKRISSNKKQGGVAPAMRILAWKILKSRPIPEFHRAEIDQRQIQTMLAKLLAAGHWREQARNLVISALRITDAAVSDGLTKRPELYVWGVLRQKTGETKPLTREEIALKCQDFWSFELRQNELNLEKYTDELSQTMILSLLDRCRQNLPRRANNN